MNEPVLSFGERLGPDDWGREYCHHAPDITEEVRSLFAAAREIAALQSELAKAQDEIRFLLEVQRQLDNEIVAEMDQHAATKAELREAQAIACGARP